MEDIVDKLRKKTAEIAKEVAIIIWRLVTASPPILLYMETNIPFNGNWHSLYATSCVSPDNARQINDETVSTKPSVFAYATPVIFRSNNGAVAYKAQVFVV